MKPAFWPPGAGLSAFLLFALAACGHASHDQLDGGLPEAMPYDAKTVPFDSGQVPQGHVDVLTQHNDMWRTGQNVSEHVLTTSNVNVNSFGKLFGVPVDGLVYAQPLIVTQYPVGDAGMHDLLVVATMNNSVYAVDANTGAPLWHVNLGPAVPSSEIGPVDDAGKHAGTQNIQVQVGILSTPVIDRQHGYVYLTRKDYTGSVQTYKLHVLSLATGQDEPGSPVTITAQVEGTGVSANDAGVIVMDPNFVAQRPGLLLLNGTVYIAFASHEDYKPYHGWVLGYAYQNGALTQTAVWNASPDGDEGGLWNGGQGLLSDGTHIYGVSSNGTVSAPSGGRSYGESFLKFSPELVVQDYFTPYDYVALNAADVDLGSGGPFLIPGTSPLLMVGGGKQGIVYVVNTESMGKLAPTSGDTNVIQSFAIPQDDGGVKAIYGAPIVWTGTGTPYLYTWAVGDPVRRFPLKDGLFDLDDMVASTVSNIQYASQDPAGTLAVSSNGGAAGTGIVWGCQPLSNPDHATVAGTCYAFDANTLQVLWNTRQNMARDDIGYFAKFVPPTVANGKLYMATHNKQVLVYGLLNGDGG